MDDDRTSLSLLGQLKENASNSVWSRFSDIYSPLVSGWLRRRGVPDDVAEDVRQEVMLQVFREIPRFDHNGRTGAFRAWLRAVMMHRLRTVRRRTSRPGESSPVDFSELADQLADDHSSLSRQWDDEHDRHVLERLLEIVASEFQPKSMLAFRRVLIRNEDPDVVAQELDMTINAVRIAQSRILAALRRVGEGFIEC